MTRFHVTAICVALATTARAEPPRSEVSPFVELSAVVADPQSNLDGLEVGTGVRIIGGLRSKSLAGFLGYRRIWTADTTFGDDQRVRIWTREILVGGRVSFSFGTGVASYVEAFWADTRLDSENSRGETDYTWHHQGSGWGARLGVEVAVAKHLGIALAIGESYAETHYDDDMGVGWLSGELAAVGYW